MLFKHDKSKFHFIGQKGLRGQGPLDNTSLCEQKFAEGEPCFLLHYRNIIRTLQEWNVFKVCW